MNLRHAFATHLAPTSPAPLALTIQKAEGVQLIDDKGKSYIDLIGGISVANVGHSHPTVIAAIDHQIRQYMHIMVYGELIQSPQVAYATKLTTLLHPSLNSVYFTNSGAEAVEGAMKLAKRVTGRAQMVAFQQSYHGSTQGALSLIGDEYYRNAYRPLLPDIMHLSYNKHDDIGLLSNDTAAVIVEPIQAEAGVIAPDPLWMASLRKRCTDLGILLIFDEIQTGFGRTGSLFAYQRLGIVPDILLLGKALGGGMPLGAFIADKDMMMCLAENPVLGHITTFGGHPVSCTAGHAALSLLLSTDWIETADNKGRLFANQLKQIKSVQYIRQVGLMMAVGFKDFDTVQMIIDKCLKAPDAVFIDWFLFANNCIRIVPPLCITEDEILRACRTIQEACSTL